MENKLDKLLKKTNKGINDAIKTLDRFQKKDITLVKTSFPFLDDVCLGGLMPNLILAILGRPSHGKCMGKGTKILMFDGTLKNVEDIIVGDKLMGSDSTPRTVLSLARGREEMYWIRQNKGIDYRVNKSHILSLKKSRQEGSGNRGDIINISVEDYLKKSDKFKSNYKGYKVPVEFPEKPLDIEPYYLGIHLGDGDKSTCNITNQDPEIIEYIEKYAEKLRFRVSIYDYKDRCNRYSISGKNEAGEVFIEKLRKLDIINNKHIPQQYLINSKENRLQLLAGLLDSDGYYSKNDNTFEIVQKNKKLAEQIVFLCNSLGFRVSMKEKKGTIKSLNFEGIYYRVSIYGNLEIIPNKVERKKARTTYTGRDWRNTGIKVEFDKVDEYYGFELDGDHLYLLEDMTVTHNTYIASQLKEDILVDKKRDIGLLYFNWEMPTFALLLTQIRKRLMIPLREILNLNPNKEQLAVMKEVADGFRDERLVTVEKSLSPTEFDYVCRKYIEENIEKEQLFIVVDHVGITKGSNKLEAIFEILEVMNNLKLDYPNKLTFIVLGQLNRDIERLWRTRDINPINLRVTSEYIYGSDALQQYADVIVASVIPEKAGLEKYCTVNRKRYEHLEEHIVDEDKASPKDYVRLKGNNRVYFDFLKVRLDDGTPKLYCQYLNEEEKDDINTMSEMEKDSTEDKLIF